MTTLNLRAHLWARRLLHRHRLRARAQVGGLAGCSPQVVRMSGNDGRALGAQP